MKIISLFCGAGGMDLGFIKAGHKVIWSNDNDPDSCSTYEKNLKHRVICARIEDIPSDAIPDGDVVIGGFPCQGFSIANPYRHIKDKRNRLYLELLRVIRDKKPKYFVAENVAGLCSIGGYDNEKDRKEQKGKILKKILNELENINSPGYHVEFKILNAADFGVPQSRKRIIILGTRRGVKRILKHPVPTHTNDPELMEYLGLKKWITLGEALKGLPEKPNGKIPNHIGTAHKVKINGFLGNRETDPKKPSPTIVGRGGGTGGPVIIPHPNSKRRLTVRETARLQSFPDDFIFEGSMCSQYRQIGNAVPWPLAYNIAKNLPLKN